MNGETSLFSPPLSSSRESGRVTAPPSTMVRSTENGSDQVSSSNEAV